MRYTPGQKEKTIRSIVKNAGAKAKQSGFGTTGVDDLMKAAGLTSGAFYKHFGSKEELLQAVVQYELGRTRALFFDGPDADRKTTLTAIATQYLSLLHLAHPESGCMLPALSAEVARASEDTRQQFDLGLTDLHGVLASISDPQTAWVALSMAVGAVSLARASANPATQKAVLSACSEALAAMDPAHLK